VCGERRGRSAGGRERSPATRAAEPANDAAFTPKGRAADTANSHPPSGLARNWLTTVKVPPSREFAVGSASTGTIAGTNAAEAVSARVSPVPRTKKTT
jgi:hypothetical protein